MDNCEYLIDITRIIRKSSFWASILGYNVYYVNQERQTENLLTLLGI